MGSELCIRDSSVAANEKLGVYGEESFANLFNEDTDNTYGTKLGAKFSF